MVPEIVAPVRKNRTGSFVLGRVQYSCSNSSSFESDSSNPNTCSLDGDSSDPNTCSADGDSPDPNNCSTNGDPPDSNTNSITPKR